MRTSQPKSNVQVHVGSCLATSNFHLEQAAAGMQEPNPKKRKIDPNAQLPPGLVGVLPDNQVERQRMIREQERIEAVIRGGARGLNPPVPPPPQWPQPLGGFNAMGAMLNNVIRGRGNQPPPPARQGPPGPPPLDFNAMLNNQLQRMERMQQQLQQQHLQRLQQRQEQLQQQQLQRLQQQQLQLEQQQLQQQQQARMQREAYERKRAMAQYKKSNPKKR